MGLIQQEERFLGLLGLEWCSTSDAGVSYPRNLEFSREPNSNLIQCIRCEGLDIQGRCLSHFPEIVDSEGSYLILQSSLSFSFVRIAF